MQRYSIRTSYIRTFHIRETSFLNCFWITRKVYDLTTGIIRMKVYGPKIFKHFSFLFAKRIFRGSFTFEYTIDILPKWSYSFREWSYAFCQDRIRLVRIVYIQSRSLAFSQDRIHSVIIVYLHDRVVYF